MTVSPSQSLHQALAPIANALTLTATEPLAGRGVLNQNDLGTTAVKMLSGSSTPRGRSRRCKILVVTPDVKVSWAVVVRGAASPANKADGDGSADEGSLIVSGASGGAVEYIDIADHLDLYLVASAASTIINITVEET